MGKSLDELASYVQPLVEKLIAQAKAEGLDPVIEDTGRTKAEQDIKIASGDSRTHNSKHLPQPPEMKSEAIDLVPRACLSLKYWGWSGKLETSHPHWGKLIGIGTGVGLANGYLMWGWDPGHFEYIHHAQQPLSVDQET